MLSFSALLALAAAVVAASAQKTTIKPDLLTSILGTPSPTTPGTPTRKGLENITVRPTDRPTVITNASGNSCKCVPYYLCDANRIAIDANNVSITGYGKLEMRLGEHNSPPPPCQESLEVCCQAPRERPPVDPTPDPSRLRGCGYRNPKGLGATVIGNGMEAQFGEFPWVVALMDNTDGSYIGVGVIIHPQVVMTGAHLAYKYGPGALKIRAGEWDTQTVKELYTHQERTVEEVYYHDGFLNESLKNDIALLRLSQPLQLAEHINTLCLPTQGESFNNKRDCVANGWGKVTFGLSMKARFAVILKKVEQDMVPRRRCQHLLRRTRLGRRFKLHDSFVCAGGDGTDICQGDGGGPLACPIGNDRYKLAGLVAWGIGCGQRDVPGVFVNVPGFRAWVDARMDSWGYGTNTYSLD